MENKFTVVYTTAEDIPGMVEAYKHWESFKGILPDKLAEGDSHEDLLKYFDGTNQTRKYVVAKSGNCVIGVCYIDLSFKSLSNIRLGDMIVKEEYRGQGIGQALVAKVIEYAKENSINKIWLYTQEELSGAVKLYEKMGFILEGKLKKHFVNKDCLVFGYIVE